MVLEPMILTETTRPLVHVDVMEQQLPIWWVNGARISEVWSSSNAEVVSCHRARIELLAKC